MKKSTEKTDNSATRKGYCLKNIRFQRHIGFLIFLLVLMSIIPPICSTSSENTNYERLKKEYVIGSTMGRGDSVGKFSISEISKMGYDIWGKVEEKLGVKITPKQFDNSTDLFYGIRQKVVDFALLSGPWEYNGATEINLLIEPISTVSVFGKDKFRHCIFVEKKQGIGSVGDLKDAKLATQEAFPNELRKTWHESNININPYDYFDFIVIGNPVNKFEALSFGEVDAVIATDAEHEFMKSQDKRFKDVVPIMCANESYPLLPLFVSRRETNPEMKEKLKNFLLSAHKDPLFQKYKFAFQMLKAKFIPISDAEYSEYRDLQKLAKKNGWDLEREIYTTAWITGENRIEKALEQYKAGNKAQAMKTIKRIYDEKGQDKFGISLNLLDILTKKDEAGKFETIAKELLSTNIDERAKNSLKTVLDIVGDPVSHGYIKDWNIIGPFVYKLKGLPYSFKFPPEYEIKIDKTYEMGNRKIKWMRPFKDMKGIANLTVLFSSETGCAAYALNYIYSPYEREMNFLIGSDDGITLWLNDKAVFQIQAARPLTLDQNKVNVKLKKGWNKILLKIVNGTGNWNFSFRVADKDGNVIKDITYSPEKKM